MTHRGNPWEAELAVSALEDGSRRLSQTHQKLFDELNLTSEHFSRLLERVQDKIDAERLYAHPNASLELKGVLESRFGTFLS
ncbi:MAG: hypothetical protein H7095_04035 [Pseudopedobacter sp.]|nr:hypothetical protein [Deinococcales bacterium]